MNRQHWISVALFAALCLAALSLPMTYDRGHEDGMRDLCGEMGGTWDDSEHGWCDTP